MIALVMILSSGLILLAVSQSFGPDVMRQVRRWSRNLPVTAASKADTNAASIAGVTRKALSDDPSPGLAADSQVSPPRRRSAGRRQQSQDSPTAPRADGPGLPMLAATAVTFEPASDVADALNPSIAESPAPPEPESTQELLEAAARLVNISWTEFEYPVHWSAGPTSRPRMIYDNHRNRLLKAIVHSTPSTVSLELARKDYAAAREQFDEDPRLDYAFGLVLWKHGEYAEAIESFQVAARQDDVPFLPAALAEAWGRFLVDDAHAGLSQLDHVARILQGAAGDYPPAPQKHQAAISLGRALGYLAGPGHDPEIAEAVELTTINILKRLPGDLRQACESGLAQVGQRQSELLQLASLPLEGIQSDHHQRRDELQARMDALRDEMREARNAGSRSHLAHLRDVQDLLEEALNLREEQESLKPRVKQLADATLEQSRPKGEVTVKVAPPHFNSVVGPGGQSQIVQSNSQVTVVGPETPAARAARISQLNDLREERKTVEQDLAKLRGQQQELLDRRQQAEQDHKREQDAARQDRAARRQEQRALEARLRALNQEVRRILSVRAGVETIAAHIPWSVEIEGEALGQALSPPGRDPAVREPPRN